MESAPIWSGIAVIDMKLERLSLQDFAGKYLVLLFYPCDFSFLCPIELIQFSDRIAEFRDLGTKGFIFFFLVIVLLLIYHYMLQIQLLNVESDLMKYM